MFPDRTDGYDLADALLNGERPEIKELKQITKASIEPTITKQTEIVSEYERVERFISNRYELRNNVVSNKIEFRARNNDNNTFSELNENNIFRELQKNHINFSMNE